MKEWECLCFAAVGVETSFSEGTFREYRPSEGLVVTVDCSISYNFQPSAQSTTCSFILAPDVRR